MSYGTYDKVRQQLFVHKSGRFTLILIEIENSLYYLVDVRKKVHPQIGTIRKNWVYLGDL